MATLARVIIGALALLAGIGALAVADGPGRFTTYPGRSAAGAALALFAGLGVAAAGLTTSFVRRAGRIGDLMLLAGFTWSAPVWVAWQDGPLVRSLAMALSGLTFPLILHAALAYPGGRIGSPRLRALVAIVYLEAVLAAVGLALFRDPYFDPSCWANCTVNVFLVHPLPSLTHTIEIVDRWFVAAAALSLVAIWVARLVGESRPARGRLMPVALAVITFAAAMAAHAIAVQSVTVEDPFNAALFAMFVAGSIAMIVLAAGLMSDVVRTQLERRAVARIVANLDEAPTPGSLQSALALALGDAELRIAYWLSDTQRCVDANGHEVSAPCATLGRTVTRLVGHGRTIALVSHVGASSDLERRIGPAIRLGLENEQLQAELLARLDQLRASRARIVETADLERRRLERDLHDGAQQRLLALSYDIRLAHASAHAGGETLAETALARAIEATHEAVDQLRDLAQGIYPAVLTGAGLGPALATLADTAQLPVEIRSVEDRRFPAAAETTAYFTVAEAVDDAARRGANHAAVTVVEEKGRLVVTVEDDGSDRTSPMVVLADRVGALGGSLLIEPTVCRVEIPCA